MAKLFNLARMTTATTGTGTITLGAAVSGCLTFGQAGVANGDVVSYGIADGANSEVGTGTYSLSGTLTRSVINSTNGNAAINLSGTAEVFITALGRDIEEAYDLDNMDPPPSTVGKALFTATDAASARSTIGAPICPSDGTNWVAINTASGANVTIPAGGTWAVHLIYINASTGVFNSTIVVMRAGGSTIVNTAGFILTGSLWRVQ